MTGHRRNDMQGLRAIAVLSVMLFHAGVSAIPGGFVGVDIFFVLSGFFITRILMRDIEENGRVHLGRFWANRAKRLLPNSLLVVLCVGVLSAAILPTYRLEGISQDAVASAAFFANFHFAAQAVDYFHLDNPPSPLLHYWSLAVEEQFYLVLPVVMTIAALIARRRAEVAIAALIAVACVASLVAALIVIEHSQPEAFFHPQYRAWQLATGGLVSLAFESRHRIPAWIRDALMGLGVVGVVASLLLLSDQLQYPGFRALFPTLGTAAILIGLDAGPFSALVSRLLSTRPMVLVGDWSYSLYLWHWPVGIFLASFWLSPDAWLVAATLALTFVLAMTAYYLVERPIHRQDIAVLGSFRSLATGAAAVALSCGAAIGLQALPGQTDPLVAERIALAAADLGQNYHDGCHRRFNDIDQPDCLFGPPDAPRVVLFGDSHAAQWFTPLLEAARREGWNAQVWTKTGCPSPDVTVWYPPTQSVYQQCSDWRNGRLDALESEPPDLVILANSSRYYGWIYDDSSSGPANRQQADLLWQSGSDKVAARLAHAGIPIVDMRDTPLMYRSYKDCLSLGDWRDCYRERGTALAGMQWFFDDHAHVTRLDLTDHICVAARCYAAVDDMILFRDSSHLTATFAGTLSPNFADLLRDAGRARTARD